MKKALTLGLAAVLVSAATFSSASAGKSPGAWLGVYTQSVDQRLVKEYDLKADHGAIVNEVVEDSPAERAGLREDDVIMEIDGQEINSSDALLDRIDEASPGDTITVTVMRGDKKMDLSVTLESRRQYRGRSDRSFNWGWEAPEAPSAPGAPGAPEPPQPPPAPNLRFYSEPDSDYGYIGIQLVDISKQTAAALGAENGGVLIDEVEDDSPASDAGLKPGDVIVAVDGHEVGEPSDVQDMIQDLGEGDIAKLDLVRDRRATTADVKVELIRKSRRWGRHGVLTLPDLPKYDLDAPRMKWLYNSLGGDNEVFDAEEFRQDMTELQKELKEMQEELKEIRKKLE